MGRELRRVPLDFDWPLNKVWSGYINPHRKPCPEEAHGRCFGGTTTAGRWLDAVARLIALLGQEAAANTPGQRDHMRKSGRIYPHPYLQEWGQAPRTEIPAHVHAELAAIEDRHERFRALDRYRREHPAQLLELDVDLAAFVSALAKGRDLGPLSGCGTSWEIARTLLTAAGMPDDWGTCKVCGGEGIDPACIEAYEAWEREPPPTGEGWQLWETVSKGSPISPVFPTEAEFVDYLTHEGYSRKAAQAFARSGWAPSMITTGSGESFRDIEACGVDHE